MREMREMRIHPKKKTSEWNYLLFQLLLVLGLVFLDQFTKHLTRVYLKDAPAILIKDVLSLRYVENKGIGFGLFQGKVPAILVLNVLLLLAIVFILAKLPRIMRTMPVRLTLLVTVSGALGNIIDRLYLGYVVDMISFDLIHFPVFNVADIFVTVSIVMFAFLYLFYYKENELEKWIFHKRNDHCDEQ